MAVFRWKRCWYLTLFYPGNSLRMKNGIHSKMTVHCSAVEQLEQIAADILKLRSNDRVFAFYGEMGAGKTTLIKALCKHLNVTDNVSSPTFALVNVYNSEAGEVYHFDVYRMKDTVELFDIGYEDYFFSGNYCFIEWPEKIEEYLPIGTIKVEIKEDIETGIRAISY